MRKEIQKAGGDPGIRTEEDIQACADAPKTSFGGEYLNDLFEMAASYIICLTIHHPFIDGNKRTALASALTFLSLQGRKHFSRDRFEPVINLTDSLYEDFDKGQSLSEFKTAVYTP